MSSLTLASISWDRGLLLFAPRRRNVKNAWRISMCAITLAICASIPVWLNHRVAANCDSEIMICALVYVDIEGNIINEQTDIAASSFRIIIMNFVTSYVITTIHLIVFGGLIIGIGHYDSYNMTHICLKPW